MADIEDIQPEQCDFRIQKQHADYIEKLIMEKYMQKTSKEESPCIVETIVKPSAYTKIKRGRR